MDETQKEITRIFGNKLRVRVCGICFQDDSILLIKHEPMGEKGVLWAPPGGGLAFGENTRECLTREMKEETGLDVEVGRLLFVNEYCVAPLHAIELFFLTEIKGGKLTRGTDPEMSFQNQVIKEVGFIPFSKIRSMDRKTLHNLFNFASSKEEICAMSGYYL